MNLVGRRLQGGRGSYQQNNEELQIGFKYVLCRISTIAVAFSDRFFFTDADYYVVSLADCCASFAVVFARIMTMFLP